MGLSAGVIVCTSRFSWLCSHLPALRRLGIWNNTEFVGSCVPSISFVHASSIRAVCVLYCASTGQVLVRYVYIAAIRCFQDTLSNTITVPLTEATGIDKPLYTFTRNGPVGRSFATWSSGWHLTKKYLYLQNYIWIERCVPRITTYVVKCVTLWVNLYKLYIYTNFTNL